MDLLELKETLEARYNALSKEYDESLDAYTCGQVGELQAIILLIDRVTDLELSLTDRTLFKLSYRLNKQLEL